MEMKNAREIHEGDLLRRELDKSLRAESSTFTSTLGSPAPSSSRILHDIPCKVCQDHSSGKHYGIFACDGCAGFFKRSVRRSRQYFCKSKRSGTCIIDKTRRNQCRACRLNKCLDAGMNKDAVQHERGPRSSTLRRQFMKEPNRTLPLTSVVASLPVPAPKSPVATDFIQVANVPEELYSEVAARLLIMNIRWVRVASSYYSLPLYDRLLLLEQSWKELFILGAACAMPSMASFKKVPGSQIFKEVIERIALANMNESELSCFRAIILFQQDGRLLDTTAVGVLQEHAQFIMHKQIMNTHPDAVPRFHNIMTLLPMMKMVHASTIVEMFFRKTIGNIPIERIITNMYKNEVKGDE